MTEYGCAVSQNFNHLLSCVYAHAYVASLLICGRAEQIGRVVGWRPGPWWEEIEGGLSHGGSAQFGDADTRMSLYSSH